jgi:glycosyltransferase involved in cell wall biosynthesis
MKIVYIATSCVPSTAANSIQVMKVCDAMTALGHEVTLLVPGNKEAPWADLKNQYGLQQTFDIQYVPENQKFKRYDFAFKAVRTANRLNPDLVYTRMLQAAVIALWHKIPTMIEMHDRVTGRVGPWLFRQFWKSKTKKRMITITGALKRFLISEFELSGVADQILVAPDGVDLGRYQNLPEPGEARRQLVLSDGFTAGYTGHFYAGRGLDFLFELAKLLPEIKFLWVGGEPASIDQWAERIESAKLGNVELVGFVDNTILPTYQAACDLLLMPYGATISGSSGGNIAEITSPMKMFEYMAAGRVIVSSDLPVIHEVLDEEMALFCPPGDLSVWEAAITMLKNSPGLCKRLGENARRASDAYTWQSRAKRSLEGFVSVDDRYDGHSMETNQ